MHTTKPSTNQRGQDSQNPHNIEAAGRSLLPSLEPSLWNSKIGRRQFVKKTGAATVGTAIALHGFRMEVMASGSDDDKLSGYYAVTLKFTSSVTLVGGSGSSKRAAVIKMLNEIKRNGTESADTVWHENTVPYTTPCEIWKSNSATGADLGDPPLKFTDLGGGQWKVELTVDSSKTYYFQWLKAAD